MLRILVFMAMFAFSQASLALGYTMEFTEAEIQQKVTAMMPMKKKKYFITVKFTNPVVDLLEKDNRIGILPDIAIKVPGGIRGKGTANISGSLRYDNKKGAFYLNKAVLKELKIDEVPDKHIPTIKDIAQLTLDKFTTVKPIYKLKNDNLKQKLAKSLLKSIKVENEKLFVELSPF